MGQSGVGDALTLSRDGGVAGKVLEKLPLGRYLQLGSGLYVYPAQHSVVQV